MRGKRTMIRILFGLALVTLTVGCFTGPFIVPVAPWVTERMNDKYQKSAKERTAVLPPILPGQPVPLCEDPPSDEEVIRALGRVKRGIPFISEEFRDNYEVVVEKVVDQVDPPTFLPLVGPVQIHHCHWKCWVFWKERLTSHHPFPYWVTNDRSEVVLIDKDHMHAVAGNDPCVQKEMFRELSGPYFPQQ